MNKISAKWAAFSFLTIVVFDSQSGELVHGFVNTDFGGNPLNGSYLLSNAQAQNTHKASQSQSTLSSSSSSSSASASSSSSATTSAGQQFVQTLNSLIMSNLANQVANKLVGNSSGSGSSGSSGLSNFSSFDTGLNTITVQSTGTGTQITIVDDKTGGQTVVNIPNN